MTELGTTLLSVKTALVNLLSVRENLADVAVSYSYPLPVPTTGENIWFGNATATDDITVMGGGELDEVFQLDCRVQVLKTQGEGQQAADIRAVQLFIEVQDQIATDATLGIGNLIQYAEIASWRHTAGALEATMGSGSAFDVKIRVRAILE